MGENSVAFGFIVAVSDIDICACALLKRQYFPLKAWGVSSKNPTHEQDEDERHRPNTALTNGSTTLFSAERLS